MAITGYEVDQVKPEVNCHAEPGQHVDAQVTHDHDGGGGEHNESGSRGLGGFACYPDCSKGEQSVRSWQISILRYWWKNYKSRMILRVNVYSHFLGISIFIKRTFKNIARVQNCPCLCLLSSSLFSCPGSSIPDLVYL